MFAINSTSFSQLQKTNSVKEYTYTTFFAELGGPGILFSANLDKRFTKSQFGWGGRVGLGFVSGYIIPYDPPTQPPYYYNDKQASVVTFPLQVNYVFGKVGSPNTFEVGGGFTIVGRKIEIMDFYGDDRASSIFGTASFMYRRQPEKGGFTWRVGFTPLIAHGYVQASAGASVGYSF